MALVVKDRVQVTTSTTGTGTLTLGSAVTGFQDFSVIGNGNTTYYAITSNGSWEVGIGTYTSSGTTLSRDTVLDSSASGSKITLSGISNVFVTYPAGKGIYLDANGNSIGLGTLASATLTNATGLPISTGVSGLGTNVATALAVNVGSSGAFVTNGGALGTPSSGTVTNLTGTASININGTVGATTPTTGSFTTLSASGVATFSAGTASAPALTTTGDTNTGIFFPAADTIGFACGGTEDFRVDGDGQLWNTINSQVGTDYTTLYKGYLCRAWVNFNGTGTPTIRASGNVSSLTDNGTGDYTVNFTTAMPDANYATTGTAGNPSGQQSGQTVQPISDAYNTGSVRVGIGNSSAFLDRAVVSIAVFR